MRTESAWAGEVRTTVDAAEHTAATVSAARRADGLLGNGIPSGDVRTPGRGWSWTVGAATCGAARRA
ncbi:hypothetical protein GCM10027072_37010 [Streptomyces bullii]